MTPSASFQRLQIREQIEDAMEGHARIDAGQRRMGGCWMIATYPGEGLEEREQQTIYRDLPLMEHLAVCSFICELRKQYPFAGAVESTSKAA